MNYIYDILLNFQDEYYDFFEWNTNDQITHIKKIPIIKVSNDDFLNIKYSIVTFDNDFLEMIYNRTQVFKKYDVNVASYMCICCSDNETIGIKLNKKGIVIGKSSLLLEESDEVLEITDNAVIKPIKYSIDKVIEKPLLQTRNQSNQSKNIIKKLNLMFKEKEFSKLNYLYYECFGKKENDINQVFSKILEEVSKYNDNYDKINDFLKIISQK